MTGTSVECPLRSSSVSGCAAHKETATTRTTTGNVTLLEGMPGLWRIRGLLPSDSTPFPPSRGMPRERQPPCWRASGMPCSLQSLVEADLHHHGVEFPFKQKTNSEDRNS